MKKKISKIFPAVMVVILSIAVGIIMYPTFMDSLNDVKQTVTISGYEDEMDSLSGEQISELRENAVSYNETIWASQQGSPFVYQGSEYDDEEYDSVLKISQTSGLMAYIEIPKISVYLPITHGTKSNDLQYRIGHLRGTSVPIGGEDTHCVLAGHSGLQNADLFTNVRKLEAGDLIYIHVLNEIHVYAVAEINTVLPVDADKYLQIEEGRDLVTLYTCTPVGLNNKRLLVRCERQYPDLEYETTDSGMEETKKYNLKALAETVICGIIPVAVLSGGMVIVFRKRKKKTKETVIKRKADK